jgi:diguanylate cyclase (GGDEF)-like protein
MSQEVSALLQKVLAERCFVGRWGGEEFLIIMSYPEKEARDFAEKIRSTLETHNFPIGNVTASFGVAEYRLHDNSDSLLKRADKALYQSKQLGRNRVEVS